MRTRAIHPGDIVLANKRGRLFHAHVRGRDLDGSWVVEPIERYISYRHLTAADIVDHWPHHRRVPDPQPPAVAPGQLDLSEWIA